MKRNTKKTNVMACVITEDGRCEQEIKTSIAMAKARLNERKLLERKLKLSLKKKLIKTLT